MKPREAIDILDNPKNHHENILSIAYNVLDKAIGQLEKKDELLKLYRKYSRGLSSGSLNLQQLLDLQKQIKALEEALK